MTTDLSESDLERGTSVLSASQGCRRDPDQVSSSPALIPDTHHATRSHFFGVAARLMRQILVDHARKTQAGKRAGHKVSLEEVVSFQPERSRDLVALDSGLKALEDLDPRKCKAVELRYFAGLSMDEIAQSLDVSTVTVRRDLRMAEAWLLKEIQSG